MSSVNENSIVSINVKKHHKIGEKIKKTIKYPKHSKNLHTIGTNMKTEKYALLSWKISLKIRLDPV